MASQKTRDRFYTDERKREILEKIATLIEMGTTRTAAITTAGISPATYYAWTGGKSVVLAPKAKSVPAVVPTWAPSVATSKESDLFIMNVKTGEFVRSNDPSKIVQKAVSWL